MALDAELLLFTPILKSEDVLHMPENVIGVDLNQTAPVGALADDVQMKGTKRCRRERSDSTGKLERVSKLPRSGTPGKRSSIYRGVTRHRWTGRYEAHLWDKSTWNVTQKKKGKQVYLGAYDEEESAARAYDLAALKYWGPTTLINFPVSDYTKDLEEMHNVSREEYLASLRRKSSGFSRGVSKYRGVARHHHNGRWEARIGRVFGNKYLYLGTYSTQEEAAAAYDMAAIEYRGVNAVTNFDLSRYIRWLRPGHVNGGTHQENGQTFTTPTKQETQQHIFEKHESPRWSSQQSETLYQLPSLGYFPGTCASQKSNSSAPTALSLLLQSSMFKQMLERVSGVHDVIDSDHDAGIELACSDLVSGQHFVEQLHSDIAKSSYEENGCGGSMYHALEDDSSGFPFGSTEESMQFGLGTDEQIPLDHGLSLWNGFLPKAGESLLGHL